jgi:hypothetical protein
VIVKAIFKILSLFLLVVTGISPAIASSTRTLFADTIKSSDNSKTYTMPTETGTLFAAQPMQETPSGTVNGSNTSFTISHTPIYANSLLVWINGVVQTQGSGKDYTISGTTITFATAPATAQIIWSMYWY